MSVHRSPGFLHQILFELISNSFFFYIGLKNIILIIKLIQSSLFYEYSMKPEYSAIKEKSFISYLSFSIYCYMKEKRSELCVSE